MDFRTKANEGYDAFKKLLRAVDDTDGDGVQRLAKSAQENDVSLHELDAIVKAMESFTPEFGYLDKATQAHLLDILDSWVRFCADSSKNVPAEFRSRWDVGVEKLARGLCTLHEVVDNIANAAYYDKIDALANAVDTIKPIDTAGCQLPAPKSTK
jgi:hypothetical protein